MGDTTLIKETLESIKNLDKPLPKGADVFEIIEQQTSEVIRASLRTWQSAYEEAKDVTDPERRELLEIYETIELDLHITAVSETIYWGIASMDFVIKDINGKPNEDLVKLFKTKWFNDWLAIATESLFWGFSGIQYGPIENDKFTEIKSIPRFNIIPELNGIRKTISDNKISFPFDKEPFATWTTLVYPRMFGDQYRLGKFNKIAKWFILKREVTQFWAIYNEIFGLPLRVTKTNTKDKVRRQNAINAMEAMTKASYAVIDLEDEIEFTSPTSGTGVATFKDFIEVADKQISKALVGSTMVLDEGSSRSQGEVHMKNTNSFIVGYASMIENLINDVLIPKMAGLGIKISAEDKFHYEQIEKISKKEWAEIISILGAKFDVDAKFVTEQLGIPVEEMVTQLPTTTSDEDAKNTSKMASFMNFFYKKRVKY